MRRITIFFMIALILSSSLILLTCCGSDDESVIQPSSQPLKAVIVSGNSAIRIDPILFSSRIALLKKGEVVDVLDQSKMKSWIGETNDFWYKIRRKNGVSGWTYGQNIKIIRSGADSLEQYINKFMQDDSKEISKALTGKWWSVNSFGDFTNHCLEIYEDNKYRSYTKGSSTFIEGEYTFDINKNQIIFLKGATFGNSLDMLKRGQMYFLQKEQEDQLLQFKRIAAEIKEEKEEEEKVKSEPEKTKIDDEDTAE